MPQINLLTFFSPEIIAEIYLWLISGNDGRYNPFENLWCTWGCSSWTWTGIWDDVRNPPSDVISNSVLGRSNSVSPKQKTRMNYIKGRPNSIFPKRNLWWRHSEDFWRHPKFRFTFNYCTPRCITDSQKGYARCLQIVTSGKLLSCWNIQLYFLYIHLVLLLLQ